MLLKKILSRVTLTSIAIIVVYFVTVRSKKIKFRSKYGPTGMSFSDSTNCSEFSKFGRFNPYSVLNDKWFVFYYWAPLRALTTFVFAHPTTNHTKYLKKILDGNCVLPVLWNARLLLMEENNKYLSLLVERGDRGEYWQYPVVNVQRGAKITPHDIRLKQTADNRILGFMDCGLESLLVMARINDVPPKRNLVEVASRLGYRGRRGKSYLYQGHEWGPVPEADESLFWDYRTKKKTSKESSKEDSEGNNKKVELEPTNKPEDSQKKIDDDVSCLRVEPVLWNDPQPNPADDPNQFTKEKLDKFEDTNTNNTLTIDVTDSLQNNIQQNDSEKESVNTQENSKLERESQNTQENNKLETESQNKQENNNLERESQNKHENNKLERESQNKQENNKLERESQNSQDNNTPESNQNSQMGMPFREPRNYNSHTEEPEMTNTQTEDTDCVVCFKSTDSAIISTNDAYTPENSHTITNFQENEPTRDGIPPAEIQGAEILWAEIPRPEIQRDEKPHAKLSSRPHIPKQDLKNSSGIIILTLDDRKS